MKPTPAGWPRISSSIFYDDPRAAIDWLCRAFGFEVQIKVEGDDGSIVHSQLTFGDGMIMVGGTGRQDSGKQDYQKNFKSPRSLGGSVTQSLCVYVDDVDAHCQRARAAGAVVYREPETNDYGDDYWVDRSYGCRDLEDHQWFFMQRLRSAGKDV